jgi:hypothetical protein
MRGETVMDWSLLISIVAIVASGFVGFRQLRLDRRLVTIEETRHRWEQMERDELEAEKKAEEERARSAGFDVYYADRDSAQTWGRVIARNRGPAEAVDAELEVSGIARGRQVLVSDGQHEHTTAERLQPGESVHADVSFTMDSPPREALRYRLSWTDGRGPQTAEKQVPLPE